MRRKEKTLRSQEQSTKSLGGKFEIKEKRKGRIRLRSSFHVIVISNTFKFTSGVSKREMFL